MSNVKEIMVEMGQVQTPGNRKRLTCSKNRRKPRVAGTQTWKKRGELCRCHFQGQDKNTNEGPHTIYLNI